MDNHSQRSMLPCKSVKDKAMCVHPRSRCFSPYLRQIGGNCNYVCVPKKVLTGFLTPGVVAEQELSQGPRVERCSRVSWIQIRSYHLITATLKSHKDMSLKQTTESVLSVRLPVCVSNSESVRFVQCGGKCRTVRRVICI